MVKVKVTNNPRLVDLTRMFALSDADMRPMLRDVDKLFRASQRTQFGSEGGSGGSKWPALSPAYARRKPKGKKIMALSGNLREGYTSAGHQDHHAAFDVRRRLIEVGTRNPVAKYHQDAAKKRDTIQQTRTQLDELHRAIWNVLKLKLFRIERVMSAWRPSA